MRAQGKDPLSQVLREIGAEVRELRQQVGAPAASRLLTDAEAASTAQEAAAFGKVLGADPADLFPDPAPE